MKMFTAFNDSNVSKSTDFPSIDLNDYEKELIDSPLWWHIQGLSQTASGYGTKLVNRYKINFNNKNYRLYTTGFSNSGKTYFTVHGRQIFIR